MSEKLFCKRKKSNRWKGIRLSTYGTIFIALSKKADIWFELK